MTNPSDIALRVVLVLSGAFVLFTALNVVFGGISTLGWQGAPDFFEVTDDAAFLVHDSHARFRGGFWLGGGLVFFAAAFDLRRFGPALQVVLVLIVLGGLSRFTQPRPEVLLSAEILRSLVAELVGVPLLWIWLSKVRASHM